MEGSGFLGRLKDAFSGKDWKAESQEFDFELSQAEAEREGCTLQPDPDGKGTFSVLREGQSTRVTLRSGPGDWMATNEGGTFMTFDNLHSALRFAGDESTLAQYNKDGTRKDGGINVPSHRGDSQFVIGEGEGSAVPAHRRDAEDWADVSRELLSPEQAKIDAGELGYGLQDPEGSSRSYKVTKDGVPTDVSFDAYNSSWFVHAPSENILSTDVMDDPNTQTRWTRGFPTLKEALDWQEEMTKGFHENWNRSHEKREKTRARIQIEAGEQGCVVDFEGDNRGRRDVQRDGVSTGVKYSESEDRWVGPVKDGYKYFNSLEAALAEVIPPANK